MRIGTGFGTFIAARTAIEIQDQQVFGRVQPLVQKVGVSGGIQVLDIRFVTAEHFAGCLRQRFHNLRELLQEFAEVLSTNANQLNVVECRAGRGAGTGANLGPQLVRKELTDFGEEADFTEILSGAEVTEHPIFTAIGL